MDFVIDTECSLKEISFTINVVALLRSDGDELALNTSYEALVILLCIF